MKITVSYFARVLAIISLSLSPIAQIWGSSNTPPAPLVESINQNLDSFNIPGASIAVVDDGKITWASGFGYADLSVGKAVTKDTLFQAASITKTLTSLAALKTLDKNQISLDAVVNDHLTRWQIPSNSFTEQSPISFRMLLNHTGGISNPYPDGCCGPDYSLPSLIQVFRGEPPATNPPLVATYLPGSEYRYCNGCYAVIQGVLEDISGKGFEALLNESVLKPAKMDASKFDNEFFLSDRSSIALPYDPDHVVYQNAPMRNPILSTGTLWTTASDLARFNLHLTDALDGGNDLIEEALARELMLPSSTETRTLGFYIGNKHAQTQADGGYLFHTGSNIGYLTISIISKDGQHGAAILINVSPEWDAREYPQFAFITETLAIINKYYDWP
ncbi:MAG TPA: serine hydrolase [Gammaproteobacteria bacterium]|jgi:CubicO group peptidase (beta-lactamase class C family)|nr:serine hydrolase [Gammaproteobacteria bacterium]|tara:strand:+ start:330 stop:1496 length:1167 start_codon:yes stop_codon:yes gene_type:complete